MALKSNIKLKDNFNIDIEFKDCYIKVSSVNGSKINIIYNIDFFKNYNEDFASDLFYSKQASFTPNMNGDNFIKQAYLHLKSLPEFADAVDC